MTEITTPVAVERAARAVFPYVRCDACRIAPHSPCMDCAHRAHNAAWSALTAARAGEPAAPTVSAQLDAAEVAEVLAMHVACYGGSDEAYAVTCSCDRYGWPMGYSREGATVHARHAAEQVAALWGAR